MKHKTLVTRYLLAALLTSVAVLGTPKPADAWPTECEFWASFCRAMVGPTALVVPDPNLPVQCIDGQLYTSWYCIEGWTQWVAFDFWCPSGGTCS